MTARKPRLPRWVLPTAAAVIGSGVFLWSLTLRDVDGNKIIDSTAVAFATVVASVLIVILQRTRTADHELKPNSGSSTKDQINRMEHMLQTVLLDVGGIRQENRDDRRAAETRFAAVETRVHDLEHPKEKR